MILLLALNSRTKTCHFGLPKRQCGECSDHGWANCALWRRAWFCSQRLSQVNLKASPHNPMVSTPGADYSSHLEVKLWVVFPDLEWKQIQPVMSGIIYQCGLDYVLQNNNANLDDKKHPCCHLSERFSECDGPFLQVHKAHQCIKDFWKFLQCRNQDIFSVC